MNEAVKKWIAALRSDAYEQGQEFLCTRENGKEKFCCLGVACDLYQQDEGKLDEKWDDQVKIYGRNDMVVLPRIVADWLELRTMTGEFGDEFPSISLTQLNDEGWSFKEIANTIENEPEGLFSEPEELCSGNPWP